MKRIGVRWTIGDVSDQGFESLALSVRGIWRIFSNEALYVICVNNVPVHEAVEKTGELPAPVEWRETPALIPDVLKPVLPPSMAQGTAWKMVPLRIFPGIHELSLDNDCILWQTPGAMTAWLRSEASCLLAADVIPAFGAFSEWCGPEPRNTGIRGFAPGFDPEKALAEMIRRFPRKLETELDEQGMQVAAYIAAAPCHTVPTSDVSICSPFPPHQPGIGLCGAHLVGLNARDLGWYFYGRPATECRREHWERIRPEIMSRVGVRSC